MSFISPRSLRIPFQCLYFRSWSYPAHPLIRIFCICILNMFGFFGTCKTALNKRELSSYPFYEHFLELANCTLLSLPQRVVDQVDFIYLACSWMTLHKFTTCPGTCRGHTYLEYLFLYLVFFVNPIPRGLRSGMTLFSSPLWSIGRVDHNDWVFVFGVFHHPVCEIFSQKFIWSHKSISFLRFWLEGENPCTNSSFCNYHVSANSRRLRILS